jgi:hypothetical protein
MLHIGDIVGFVVLAEDKEFQIPQEYAGASTTVLVKAGRYPVTYNHDRFGRWGSSAFGCKLPGVVVRDFFLNRLGASTSASVDKHVGKEMARNLSWRWYELTSPFGYPVELLDTIVVEDDGEYSDGTPRRTMNFEKSEGLDPVVFQSPEANPYPGSEYLKNME